MGDFSVKFLKSIRPIYEKDKIYHFVNGRTTLETGNKSLYYADFEDFVRSYGYLSNGYFVEFKNEETKEEEKEKVNMNGNFKMICVCDDLHGLVKKDKVYEFVNGQTMFEGDSRSLYYKDFKDFCERNYSIALCVKECKDGEYGFKPFKIKLASTGAVISGIGLKILNYDVDIKNLDSFIVKVNGRFIDDIQVDMNGMSSVYNKTMKRLIIGKPLPRHTTITSFYDNRESIEFMLEVHDAIDKLNSYISTLERNVLKNIFSIEHEPDGRRYYFKSKDDLKVGDLVICDTIRGKTYGVVKEILSESVSLYKTRSDCKKA